jgi:FAD/FMN-containing dehydrogenase
MAVESLSPGATWTNWVGNQSFSPALAAAPVDEVEVVRLVRDAAARGATLRVAGAGHSFTPLVETDGVLLDLSALAGVMTVDRDNATVTALPATTIGMFGEPLWDLGLALENQGDIDTQQIAGAVATGTHGSGVGLRSFSGLVRSMRLVTGTGDVLDVDGSQPDLLHAAQVAMGMLGVMTRLELQVVPAYRLAERIDRLPYAEVLERWDELVAAHRHFSFFWLPSEESAALYGLTTSEGERAADSCYVKVYDEAAPDRPDDATSDRRVDRSYRIYPHVFEPNFHELEYCVPIGRAQEAIAATRELMLRSLPDSVFPMEVRTTAADEAFLSPAYRTPTAVISVSGVPGTDHDPYLRSVDAILRPFSARVHWGKLHFLTRDRLLELYPAAERFIEIRRELDPAGTFLNGHLRELFE